MMGDKWRREGEGKNGRVNTGKKKWSSGRTRGTWKYWSFILRPEKRRERFFLRKGGKRQENGERGRGSRRRRNKIRGIRRSLVT